MPYIKPEDRLRLARQIDNGREPEITTAGELNYLITKLLITYLQQHELNYATCNDIVGALDNAKDEFKRRIQDKYEDQKIYQNGEVYPALGDLVPNLKQIGGNS